MCCIVVLHKVLERRPQLGRVLVVYFSSLNVTTLFFYGLLLAAAQDVLPVVLLRLESLRIRSYIQK